MSKFKTEEDVKKEIYKIDKKLKNKNFIPIPKYDKGFNLWEVRSETLMMDKNLLIRLEKVRKNKSIQVNECKRNLFLDRENKSDSEFGYAEKWEGGRNLTTPINKWIEKIKQEIIFTQDYKFGSKKCRISNTEWNDFVKWLRTEVRPYGMLQQLSDTDTEQEETMTEEIQQATEGGEPPVQEPKLTEAELKQRLFRPASLTASNKDLLRMLRK